MSANLTCFNCKEKSEIKLTKEQVYSTKNNRYFAKTTCPKVKPDGVVCGRVMTSLISKTQYEKILNPEPVTEK